MIAFCIRGDYATRVGGDTIQLRGTKEWLERAHGVRGDIVTDPDALERGRHDLCHVFNLQSLAKTARFVARARQCDLPVALSTIYWDFSHSRAYESQVRLGRFNVSEAGLEWMIRAKMLEARLFNRRSYFGAAYRRDVRGVLESCAALLPNSTEELSILAAISGLPLESLSPRTSVVFNAAGSAALADDGEVGDPFPGTEEMRGRYVLQAGRIEPCKNQHSLIRALFGEPHIPIVLVGQQNAHPAYHAAVRAIAERRGNVHVFDHQPQDMLRDLYRNAAVHVLPSLRESPGLATLEALGNNGQAVVSERRFCPVDSYFGDAVTTVNPLDVASIRSGVLTAMESPRDLSSIRRRIREEFTWEMAARQTYAAYVRVSAA